MAEQLRSNERYRVGALLLDAEIFRLEHDGCEITLPKLSFDLLLALVRRAPNVATTQELMDAVWPNLVVAEETVGQRVRLVREALGPDWRAYITTVRGRGYRISVPVEAITPAAETGRSGFLRERSFQGFGFAGVSLVLLGLLAGLWLLRDPVERTEPTGPEGGISDNSIAVLPFVNLSGDAADDYFSEGIAEEMLDRLARVQNLTVISRTSSFAFKDAGLETASIAKRLSVRYLLEGSVRKVNNRVRVTAKLIDVESDSYIMSHTFERELNDIFAVQDEISGAVIAALPGEIRASDQNNVLRSSRLTEDVRAYDLYLEAKYYLHLRGLDAVSKSIELLEMAIEIDPEFAQAYAVLASAYTTIPFYSNDPSNLHVNSVEEAANKALSLDESIALAEAVLGTLAGTERWNWDEAERHFERALELEPNNATIWQWYAEFLLRVARFRDANEAAKQSVRLDPAGSSAVNVLGLTHFYLDEDEKALEYAKRARDSGRLGGYLSAMVFIHREQFDAAALSWKDAAPATGLSVDWIDPYISALGDPSVLDEAITAIDRARDGGNRTPSGFVSEFVLLGEIDRAYDAIDDELEKGMLYTPIIWEPSNSALRGDSRFSGLLERMRIPEYWDRHGWPQRCQRSATTITCD